MTGPEHYAEAERLAAHAETWADAGGWAASMSTGERLSRRVGDLAAAQVHAMLALAAATVDLDDGDAWQPVLSGRETAEGITGMNWDNLGPGGSR